MVDNNLKVTLQGDPSHFDILGRAISSNDSLADLIGPTAASKSLGQIGNFEASQLGQPSAAPTLRGYMPMPSAAPQPQQAPVPSGPPMRGSLLGRIPKAIESGLSTAWHSAAPVLGKIGEVAGSALVPNLMKDIPGTDQYKQRLQGEEQERQDFGTEQGLKKAQTDEAEARATHLGEGATPGETLDDRKANWIKVHGQEGGPGYEDYVLTGNLPAQRTAEESKPDVIQSANGDVIPVKDAQGNWVAKPFTTEPIAAKPVDMNQGVDGPQVQKPLDIPGGLAPASGDIAGQQVMGKPPAEKTPSDINQYTADYLAAHSLPDNPQNRLIAHKAFTKETKVDPGILRVEAFGDTRGMGVTLPSGETVPMNWNQINKQSPGALTMPAYNPD